jgi:hypothetical protein
MLKPEDFQNYGKEQFDAAVQSANAYSKGVQAIALEISDYSKKSFEEGGAYFEKLAGVKSFEKVFEVQSDFAKSAYESFVAEATKLGEMYTGLAKDACKPFEGYFSKLPRA